MHLAVAPSPGSTGFSVCWEVEPPLPEEPDDPPVRLGAAWCTAGLCVAGCVVGAALAAAEGVGLGAASPGHVSSSLTAPRSIFTSLVAAVPAVGVWVQTFQLRSRICIRSAPEASCEVRL